MEGGERQQYTRRKSAASRLTFHASRFTFMDWNKGGACDYEPQNRKWNTHSPKLQIAGWINDIKLDDSFVWIATTDGLVYYDRIARVSGKLTEKDGLPSEIITPLQ